MKLITFKENPQECVDTDNDGVGNNADSDDDDDGWTDADEIRLNARFLYQQVTNQSTVLKSLYLVLQSVLVHGI